MSTVVSVRIKKEIKELLEKENVNINEEVKKFLEELASKIKMRKYVAEWDKILENVKPSEKGFAERSIREDRESH
ncbi:MAG: VapB-type antitoxin [Thermoproteota archaeon]|jgi:predicted transcriptional regulator